VPTLRLRIVGIGDSTTAGTPGFLSPLESPPDGAGNPESQYAFWMRRSRPEWEVVNCGINGEESAEVRSRLARDVLRRRPDCVVILAGVNDVFRGRSVGSITGHLSAMYEESRVAGIHVVTASVLPYNSMSPRQAEAIRELNRWIERTSSDAGFPFCDTHKLAGDPRDPDRLRSSPDGLHPDVAGYRRMGEGLVSAIEAGQP
jgi:lysophospholipase L1-like esterase